MWNSCANGRVRNFGQRLLSEKCLAGEALIRSFRVPESGETVGGNARVMNQSCPVSDVSKQYADFGSEDFIGTLWVCHLVRMLAGEQLR